MGVCVPSGAPYAAGVPEQRLNVPTCPLCVAARITPWHHEDDICWIADCDICATPMVVWRGHGIDPPADELEHMMAQLSRVATEALGPHWVDGNRRNIPDHFHAHSRPVGGFFGPGGGPR
ncbi:MAG: hypothetical protein JWM47_805 [Acidimicrobiales bacterium]|nr:hypothetical protein [Acidimicrobiales bacterium]